MTHHSRPLFEPNVRMAYDILSKNKGMTHYSRPLFEPNVRMAYDIISKNKGTPALGFNTYTSTSL